MKKHWAIAVSVIFMGAALAGILVTQLVWGRNPPAPVMLVLLAAIGGGAETAAFIVCRNKLLKLLPLLVSAAVGSWGAYLYLCSGSWVNAAVADLICDYFSPVIGCVTTIILIKYFQNRAKRH